MSAIITPITKPFAQSGTLVPLPNGPDSFVANQTTGYPNSQAIPLPAGKEVRQDQTNGLLNFYTNLMFQQGQGYQYTFDNNLSTVIGGYPEGAILWCASNSTWQQSLIANNIANFVTTTSYINDGINWSTVSPYPSILNPDIHNFTIATKSPIYPLASSSINLSNISSSDAKNGYPITTYEITRSDGTSVNKKTLSWTELITLIEPYENNTLTTSNRLTIVEESGVDATSGNLLKTIYLKNADTTINNGIKFEENRCPELVGDYKLPVGNSNPGTILTVGCTRIFQSTQFPFSGFAIWDGAVWAVTLSGRTAYVGPSTSTPIITINLGLIANGGFGAILSSNGPASSADTFPSSSNIECSCHTTTSDQLLYIQGKFSGGVTNLSFSWSINFTCGVIG